MKKIFFLFAFFISLNAQNALTQPPFIVEFPVFKEAEAICKGSDYTKIACLIETLKNYNNKIYTKLSGQSSKIIVIFYALDSNGRITYPKNVEGKRCEFVDTLGRKSISKLSENGFTYVLNYNFAFSSSYNKAYIACHFNFNNKTVSQITQPITVIPSDFDANFTIRSAQDSVYNLNTQDPPTPNLSNLQSYEDNIKLVLKAKTSAININQNAVARTINGNIDEGFNSQIFPLFIRFSRDNGLCSPIGENVNGNFTFRNGRYFNNNININFLDVASGDLELVLGHDLDLDDKAQGKCLSQLPNNIDITNAGKILCQELIVIKKRVDIVPHSFFVELDNNGKQIYYNQHTFIPSIAYLPTIKLNIQALNDRNQLLKNFTKDCYAKDLSVKLDDNKNNFLFINGNIPDSIIPKDTFLQDSNSQVIRKLSSSGIKDRGLTPLDLFHSNIINLNDTYLRLEFYNKDVKYPIYFYHPKIKNDWRIALMRGRISLISNVNESTSLVANPKINYEFYCKSPVCKVVDFESILSPYARFPKSQTQDWYINTAHPLNFKVMENNIILSEGLSIYSIGNIINGIQTLAIESNKKGVFDIKIRQGSGYDDFALFLYFSPNYINIREDLGVDAKLNF